MPLMRSVHTMGWPRMAVVCALGVAVMAMHILVAGPDRPPHSAASHGSSHDHAQVISAQATGEQGMSEQGIGARALSVGAGTHGVEQVSMSARTSRSDLDAADHCDVMGHDCVFVRADPPPLPMIVLLLFICAFVAVPALLGRWTAVRAHLGRPPPWTVFGHLELSVIRC